MSVAVKRSRAETADPEHDEEQQRFTEAVSKKAKLEVSNDFLQQKIERERANADTRGVIYIGHLPHGFYEDELRKYFSQFGEVTRVRVSRSRKTGGSRGYAFVEFLHKDVAQVAAETMNGYLMFEKILKVHLVPIEKVHHDMFAPRFPFPLNREITRTFINMERTETREVRNKQTRLQKLNRKMQALKHLGIDYDLVPVGAEGVTLAERKSKSANSAGESESDGENCTLLVDSDDDEIDFKTPPHGKKKSLKGIEVKTDQEKESEIDGRKKKSSSKKSMKSTSVSKRTSLATTDANPIQGKQRRSVTNTPKQIVDNAKALSGKKSKKFATSVPTTIPKTQEGGKRMKRRTIM